MKITFIGDPHGKMSQYKKIVMNEDPIGNKTISLGDNGFSTWATIENWLWSSGEVINPENHVWLAGNHDIYPNKQYKQSLGDYGVWNNIYFVRGAKSIDLHQRTEGIDYFADEEMSYSESMSCYDEYLKVKPKYVISHDCPYMIKSQYFGYNEKTVTTNLLWHIFIEHKPEYWIFGHYHRNFRYEIDGVKFVCLNELETMTIEV